jgi:hypothetical protein
MKKFAFAAICTFAMVGFVLADDIVCTIIKVDGSKVTYVTGKKGEDQKEATAEALPDVKVMKGSKMKGDAAYTVGDKIEKGLKDEVFAKVSKDMGQKAQITTDAKGKITQILVIAGKKKGG